MYNNLLSKKSKKAISALLASALVISAAPTSVAEAAVTKTFTLGVGKTATKTVSATIKSVKTSKKAVVTVKKVAAKKYKLTAKAAGKATVTVKYGKKTLKATVKVGATKVTKKAFNATMKVNETQSLKIGTTNGKKDTIQWSTSDANVVSIAKTSTKASAKGNTSVKATAVAAGTAKVTAKSKFTGKKATFAITVEADATTTPAPTTDVTVSPSTDVTASPSTDVTVSPSTEPTATPEIKSGVTAKVENQIPGYDNVVLVNDNAIVTVSVKDDAGKPLANKTVIMSASTYGTAPVCGNGFETKGNAVVTTNDKGEASFIIGHKTIDPDVELKITSEDYVGAAKYTATVVGENKSYSGYVGFAAIVTDNLTWVDDDDITTDDLVPGTNAKAVGYGADSVNITSGMNNIPREVQYVGAQQVSTIGGNEHKVSFSAVPGIKLPDMGTDDTETKNFTQPVNVVSGEYGTYDKIVKTIPMEVDMSQLQYATLNFRSIQLSKYTKMTIECFADEKCEDPIQLSDGSYAYELNGERDQKVFGYQIPKNTKKSVKTIRVSIISAGQVQKDRNAGFDIESITGVYDTANVKIDNDDPKPLTSAKITWEAVTPVYSEIKTLKNTEADELGIKYEPGSTFTYQVPVFPYTGNAVIKEYDANGQLIKYYVAPTERKDDTKDRNTNDINFNGKDAYQVSEDEATVHHLEGVSQDGNVVTVNAEKVGSTTVQGTITIDGLGSGVLNEATSKLYTSVQWNPIPVEKEVGAVDSDAAIALVGQKIIVYAQLTDANNNVMTGEKDVIVTFKADDEKGTEVTLADGGVPGDEGVSVISKTPTDVNGRAKLVLSAASAEELLNLHAEVADDKYKVVLQVENDDKELPSNKLDLYWVNANLEFKDSVVSPSGVTVKTQNDTRPATAQRTLVGSPWEFGFKVIGDDIEEGYLKDYAVEIEDAKIETINYDGNKGTYEVVGNGKVNGTSSYDNTDVIGAKLGANSVSEDMYFTLTKGDTEKTYKNVGDGAPNINAKINLSVDWEPVGTVIDIMTVEGASISDGETTMYIKVTDDTGVNPLVGGTVNVSTSNGDILNGEDSSVEVTTNEFGVAVVTLKQKDSTSQSSIVTATVKNTDKLASKTINWVPSGNDFALLGASKVDDNKVELLFNNEIYAGSVNAEEFELTSVKDGKKVYYSVKDATVSGTKIILTIGETLGAEEYTVTVGEYAKNSVKYNVVDERGLQLMPTRTTASFYGTKNATYDVSVVSPTAIKLENVKSPVVTSGTAINDNIIVTVDGKVVGYTATIVPSTDGEIVKAYELELTERLAKGNVVRVCYMGSIESVTVK